MLFPRGSTRDSSPLGYIIDNPNKCCIFLFPVELGLRAESEQHQGGEVTAAFKGKRVSSVESNQLQPLLTGAMGTLDRVRRTEQSASSPELSPFGEAERLHL